MDLKQRTLNRLAPSLLVGTLLCLATLISGCNKKTRNVLFDTTAYMKKHKELKKSKPPLIHINKNPDFDPKNYQHRIRPDDRISIRFLNNFDITQGVTITEQGAGNTGVSFLVDKEGKVNLPMLGKVQLEGYTKQEAREKLEKMYTKDFVNPSIEVTVQNLSVTVQGEVKNPGVFELARERTTLLEIIAEAGGITQYGKNRKVKVVRNVAADVDPEILIFDLTQLDAIESEYLVLRDKDIIYVEPRDIRVIATAITPYTGFLSLLSTVATVTVVVINISRN